MFGRKNVNELNLILRVRKVENLWFSCHDSKIYCSITFNDNNYFWIDYEKNKNGVFVVKRCNVKDEWKISEQEVSEIKDYLTKNENIIRIASDVKAFKSSCIEKHFMFNDKEFLMRVDDELGNSDIVNVYPSYELRKRIVIKASNTQDNIFYYDFDRERLEENVRDITKKLNDKIMDALPVLEFGDIPLFMIDFIRKVGTKYYKTSFSGEWMSGEVNFALKLLCNYVDVERKYMVPYNVQSKKEIKNKTFLEELKKEGDSVHLEKMDDIAGSIKYFLSNLKEKGVVLNTLQKIKIPDKIFFREISDEKKIIDDFFSDIDIIKNCDLSEIDFTNAVLEEANLEDSGANIVLSEVYGGSIKNANLKGMALYGQELEGIVADGANLRNTGIVVMVDKVSIKGAKFSLGTTFMLNNMVLSEEIVRSMGIELYQEEEEIKLELQAR